MNKNFELKIVFILPVYNEGQSIFNLISRIDTIEYNDIKIIVIDDCSKDDSFEWMSKAYEKYSKKEKYFIKHIENKGLGGALNSGFEYLFKNFSETDVVVTMDGDDTHDPNLIYQMIEKISQGDDVVIASRYRAGSMIKGVPIFRIILSYGARFIYQYKWRIPGVRDYTCLYRAYKYVEIEKLLKKRNKSFLDERDFVASSEILRKIFINNPNLSISEVPLKLNYSLKIQSSNMQVLKTVIRTFKLLFSSN